MLKSVKIDYTEDLIPVGYSKGFGSRHILHSEELLISSSFPATLKFLFNERCTFHTSALSWKPFYTTGIKSIQLAHSFHLIFEKFERKASKEIVEGGPLIESTTIFLQIFRR